MLPSLSKVHEASHEDAVDSNFVLRQDSCIRVAESGGLAKQDVLGLLVRLTDVHLPSLLCSTLRR